MCGGVTSNRVTFHNQGSNEIRRFSSSLGMEQRVLGTAPRSLLSARSLLRLADGARPNNALLVESEKKNEPCVRGAVLNGDI